MDGLIHVLIFIVIFIVVDAIVIFDSCIEDDWHNEKCKRRDREHNEIKGTIWARWITILTMRSMKVMQKENLTTGSIVEGNVLLLCCQMT